MDGAATEIRVLLVDDHAIERQGVRSLLDAQPDIRVVAEAGDGLEALPLISQCHPDVVVTETIMPRMNGLELTGQLLRRYPDLKVLVLTRNDREDCVLAWSRPAPAGTCSRRSTGLTARRAARRRRGGRVLSRMVECVLDDYRQRCATVGAAVCRELTPRELSRPSSSSPRATPIRTSPTCCASASEQIETHRSNIMDKLDLHKVTDLVKYAIREGLVGLDLEAGRACVAFCGAPCPDGCAPGRRASDIQDCGPSHFVQIGRGRLSPPAGSVRVVEVVVRGTPAAARGRAVCQACVYLHEPGARNEWTVCHPGERR